MTAIAFYFDFISPNAFLAWDALPALAARHGRAIDLHPVLFAALLQAHAQRGPAEVAPKMDWMVRNCLRKAHARGLELQPPASHPFNPLLALRVCHATHDPAERSQATRALFAATWQRGVDVADAVAVAATLDAAGCDGAALVAAAQTAAAKRALRSATDAALARGVFGVPMFFADDEPFFGYDDLDWLDRFLGGGARIDEPTLARWRAVRPSAWRRAT